MENSYQRIGLKSNVFIGKSFELTAQSFFSKNGVDLNLNVKIPVGISEIKKHHSFDLGCLNKKILVECKSHKWTTPKGNVPSAKLAVWNEAMYYFLAAPINYRKIMFVLRDYNTKRKETLAEYYVRNYSHLIPVDVELWEFDQLKRTAMKLEINDLFK